MQDSLPVGWLAFTGRELNPLDHDERFPSCYISSPFPGFILTLPSVISADLSSDPWTPTAVADKVRLPVSSPVTSAFPKDLPGRLNHDIPLNDFRAGRAYAAAVIR
jgi:hypothetical protein